ncbi:MULTISPECIES: hypothetical protein [Geobacillus]|nr:MULTISPECIES: hypothetical protein [Geobacillus]MED3747594.1 hypothetical protein [Geobacillus stearothermophilus]MED3752228.1 hypothetical protein [Geobacillus stearothermophilus]
MNMECPRCGAETHWEVVEIVEGKGYVWEAECDECGWEDSKYEF